MFTSQNLRNCAVQFADAVIITFSYSPGADFSVGHALSGCHADTYYTLAPQLMAYPGPQVARLVLGEQQH